MPLTPGSSPKTISQNIRELHTGKTFAHTAGKFGKKDADKQAVAIALSNARKTGDRASGGAIGNFDLGGVALGPINPFGPGANGAGMPAGVAPPTMMPNMQMPNAPQGMGVGNASMLGMNPGMPNPGMSPGMMPPGGMPPTMNGVAPPESATPVNNPMQRPLMSTGGSIDRATGGVGGFNMAKAPHLAPGYAEKQLGKTLNRGLISGMTKGPILSAVPGRTDAHKTHVPSGSYVIPADIVSGRGQGNTIAGAQALGKLFKMGPYGGPSVGMKAGNTMPKPPAMRAAGGETDDSTIGAPVRVNLAGGEIVVPPENLLATVHPDLKTAHNIMDAWVLNERKMLRDTLAKLPGPVQE